MKLDQKKAEDLDQLPLLDKCMMIVSDIQELAKQIIEKKSNVLESYESPTQKAFEDFFEKEGKNIKEQNPGYVALLSHPNFQQQVVEYSLGDKKTTRKASFIEEAFTAYRQLVVKKIIESKDGKKPEDLHGVVENQKLLEKIKDMIEFIYIYRFNTRDTEVVLNYLNTFYDKKYGQGFLQNHMEIYQTVEELTEKLAHISDKVSRVEELISEETFKTVEVLTLLFFFYARGDLDNLMFFYKTKMHLIGRDYIVELILKRAEIKGGGEKIQTTVEKAKELVNDMITKLNTRELPAISKTPFERLMNAAVRYHPESYRENVCSRLRTNIYAYMRSEKGKNG